MPRTVTADDLELYAINTGEFYQTHLNLVGHQLGEWLEHVQNTVVPLYCKQIEPVTATGSATLTTARNLMSYYQRHAAETKALAESDREKEYDARGRLLIDLLGLTQKANGRVDTNWGDKTPQGLFLTVLRVCTEDIAKLESIG